VFVSICIPCVISQSCSNVIGGNLYNFQSMLGQSFSVSSTTSGLIYRFTPCQNGVNGPSSLAQLASFQNTTPMAPLSVFDNTMQWSPIANGVQFTTFNGGPPRCYPSNQPQAVTMQFVCSQTTAPVLSIITEASTSTCSVAPGWVFQLSTPLACSGFVPPTGCPYWLSQPCLVQDYNIYSWANGETLVFNQGQPDACGSILFSDYVIKAQPVDTCANATSSGGYRLVAHMDTLLYPTVLQMLKLATTENPIIFFWDYDSNTAAIGSAMTVSIV